MLGEKLLCFFLACSSIHLLLGVGVVHCSLGSDHGPRKMFVFGDSYADTGNDRHPAAPSWMPPYGVTFPGRPSGRFSDGRVFTDFLGNATFKKPLIPCCMGLNSTYSCGSLDIKGNKMYTICPKPNSYFFWDSLHPTQAGWEAVTQSLLTTIKQLQY